MWRFLPITASVPGWLVAYRLCTRAEDDYGPVRYTEFASFAEQTCPLEQHLNDLFGPMPCRTSLIAAVDAEGLARQFPPAGAPRVGSGPQEFSSKIHSAPQTTKCAQVALIDRGACVSVALQGAGNCALPWGMAQATPGQRVRPNDRERPLPSRDGNPRCAWVWDGERSSAAVGTPDSHRRTATVGLAHSTP